jgi:hypothetical protein
MHMHMLPHTVSLEGNLARCYSNVRVGTVILDLFFDEDPPQFAPVFHICRQEFIEGPLAQLPQLGFPPLFEVPVSARHTITTHSPLLTCYEPRSNCLFLVRSGSISIMAGRFVRSSKYRTYFTAIPRSYRALTCFSRPRIWKRYA